MYEQDADFGYVNTVDSLKSSDQLLPNQKIDAAKLSHITEQQQKEQLAVLNEFSQCFSDNPGFCNVVQHEIYVTSAFKPKRLRAYQFPESIKPEVKRQIRDMLNFEIIKPSESEMMSRTNSPLLTQGLLLRSSSVGRVPEHVRGSRQRLLNFDQKCCLC